MSIHLAWAERLARERFERDHHDLLIDEGELPRLAVLTSEHLPEGVRYSPSLPNEARNERALGRGILVGPKFFDLPDAQQRYVLDHEVGHDLADAMFRDGSAWEITGMSGDIQEDIADLYATLIHDPQDAQRWPEAAALVKAKAQEYGMTLRSIAMPSWRPFEADDWTRAADYVIASDTGSRQSGYEIYVDGWVQARLFSLEEAQQWAANDAAQDLSWLRIRMPKVTVNHPTLGPTTRFTEPKQIWVADRA